MKINVVNSQKDLKIDVWQVKRTVKALLAFKKVPCDEITVYFVTEKKICQLHAQYFNDPTPTDCITFPMDNRNEKGYTYLGDVFICPQTALKYCQEHSVAVFEELSLYLIHTLLHLLGYNDITDKQRQTMQAEEKNMIEMLKQKNLLLRTR